MENDDGSAPAPRSESDKAQSAEARNLMERSRSSVRAGNAQEALMLIDQAIALNPRISGLHLQRSRILNRLADAQGAIVAARTATGLAPDNAGFKAYLSGLLQRKGALAPALKLIEQAIALDDTETGFQRQRAELLEALAARDAPVGAAKITLLPDPEETRTQATGKSPEAQQALSPLPAESQSLIAAPAAAGRAVSTAPAQPAVVAEPSKGIADEQLPEHRSEVTRLLEEIQKPAEKARPGPELSARKLPMGSRQDLDSLPQLSAPRLSPINPFPPRPQGARNDRGETRRPGLFARLFRWFS